MNDCRNTVALDAESSASAAGTAVAVGAASEPAVAAAVPVHHLAAEAPGADLKRSDPGSSDSGSSNPGNSEGGYVPMSEWLDDFDRR